MTRPKWCIVQRKFENSFALSDIIEILSNGIINTLVGHGRGLLSKKPATGAMEIFANLSCIDVLELAEKEEVIKELIESYKEIVK